MQSQHIVFSVLSLLFIVGMPALMIGPMGANFVSLTVSGLSVVIGLVLFAIVGNDMRKRNEAEAEELDSEQVLEEV